MKEFILLFAIWSKNSKYSIWHTGNN